MPRAPRLLPSGAAAVVEYALSVAGTAVIMVAVLALTVLAVQAAFEQAQLGMRDPLDRPVICGSVC